MSATAKENRLLRQELAGAHTETDAHKDVNAALSDVVGMMAELPGESAGIIAQKDREISSLTRLLSTCSGADSPSGKDPRGYEATKEFLAISRAYEEAMGREAAGGDDGTDGEPPKEVRAKPCGGRPGHRGVSHHVKTDRTVTYAAEMCGGCGRTDLELMDPINKPTADFGGGEGEDS